MDKTEKPAARRVHAYCVGQAKSGTGSLWGVFKDAFRAEHEPLRQELLDQVVRLAGGNVSDAAAIAWLRERDRRLGLELDIAWGNFFVLDRLVATFPDAKFIVLVRDCYTWLNSIVGHLLTREMPGEVRAFMDFWFEPATHPHGPNERGLREAGLYSLAAFLDVWKTHVETCVARIPAERMLLVRTHELARSWDRIAEFLGVDAPLLDRTSGHINCGAWTGRITSLVDERAIEGVVERVCGETMRRFFPELARMADAGALYGATRGGA